MPSAPLNLFGEEDHAPTTTLRADVPYARIAIDVPLPRTFTYINPIDQPLPPIGTWVLAPFGAVGAVSALSGLGSVIKRPNDSATKNHQASKRRLVGGLIMGYASEPPAPNLKLKAWDSVIDTPPMNEEWMNLVHFASDFYHYPIGQTIAAAFPLALRSEGAGQQPKPPQPIAWRFITEPEALLHHSSTEGKRSLKALLHELSARSADDRLIMKTSIKSGTALAQAIREWHTCGFVVPLFTLTPPREPHSAPPTLTQEQAQAVQAISSTSGFNVHVLQGITGSGKTEVYFSLADQVLDKGQQVLILMPEIALTPQMENRLRYRFPTLANEALVVLHSGLSPKIRQSALLRAMKGEAKIIVGTRSGVFAPLCNLGLIVVDEEHDGSFKQNENAFCYSARDLAIVRAKAWACSVVLGSATPSLESFHHAAQGRYRYHTLTHRATGALLPTMDIINTRGQKMASGLAKESLTAINTALSADEQCLIFLNRRGYAPAALCEACGWIAGCPSCSANLVLHTADRALRCHHCGYSEKIVPACPQCGNPDVHLRGFGTQKLEETLHQIYPIARLVRIDRDATKNINAFARQQRAIAEREVDLIIGTQMMAKGHDFPHLTTVVILGADAVLFASDFRGAERLFSLLTQVAGRAGRHQKPGRVLVQTAWSEHPLFNALIKHDYSTFARAQLAERENIGAPPFSYQAILRVEAVSLKSALDWMKAHQPQLQRDCPREVTLYDIVPMRLARKAGWERLQMLVESRHRSALQAFMKKLTAYLYGQPTPAQLKWWVDIQPLEL